MFVMYWNICWVILILGYRRRFLGDSVIIIVFCKWYYCLLIWLVYESYVRSVFDFCKFGNGGLDFFVDFLSECRSKLCFRRFCF